MTSLHRGLPAWTPTTPHGDSLTPFTMRLHFSTARPLEVRLRVPLGVVDPAWTPPICGARDAWVGWSVDREMLKGSAWVHGSKFGIGDVQIGQSPAYHWVAHLRRAGRCITIATQLGWVREFVNAVDGVSAPETSSDLLDIDGVIARLLEAGA